MGAVERQRVSGTSSVGSFVDSTDQAVIILRGDVDGATVARLRQHIADFLADTTLFIVIDARAVESYDQNLLDLMGRTQRRLGRRRGMLRVLGLHPALMTDPEADAGDTASRRAPQNGSMP